MRAVTRSRLSLATGAVLVALGCAPAGAVAGPGDIFTVAGTSAGLSGDGLPATTAQLNGPVGVAPTADGAI